MSAAPRVTVVVPTFQRRDSVVRLLNALSRQTLPAASFEVVVSIDGSTDGSREAVAAVATPYALRSLWQPNRGRAAACNAAIRESRGEIVVILDDDMEPAAGCLAAHLRAHDDRGRRAVLGAVPVVLDAQSPPAAALLHRKFQRQDERLARADDRIGWRDFYSGNLSIPRDLLLAAGLYDEGYREYGNEDGELALRLLAAGVELVYSREAQAAQHYDKDFAALARDTVSKGRTAVRTLRRHPETFSSSRLAYYHTGSRRWRLLRAVLLRASAAGGLTPRLVTRCVEHLERRRSAQLHRSYRLALDYFFWLGALSELRACGLYERVVSPRAGAAERRPPDDARAPSPAGHDAAAWGPRR